MTLHSRFCLIKQLGKLLSRLMNGLIQMVIYHQEVILKLTLFNIAGRDNCHIFSISNFTIIFSSRAIFIVGKISKIARRFPETSRENSRRCWENIYQSSRRISCVKRAVVISERLTSDRQRMFDQPRQINSIDSRWGVKRLLNRAWTSLKDRSLASPPCW